MWETPFSTEMLCGRGVIILCPEEGLATELMWLLEENGVMWSNGNAPTKSHNNWSEHRNETCYWIENGLISYGSMGYAEDEADDYTNHTKCTFYGVDTPDFDTATDDELRSFLGT